MYPTREEFTELIYYISELKHTYSHKIDEQSIKINEQSMIIEELLWQIRELSDKIRQLNQWRGETDRVISDSRKKFDEITKMCRYENHIPKNRIVNSSRRSRNSANAVNIRKNDKEAADDDIYEVIEFSDSSQHIYTEPFDKTANSNYGALRRVNVKTITTTSSSSNHTVTANVVNKRSATSKTKMGIKKSSRVRNLQKFPAMQDISKASNNSTDDDNKNEIGEKVQLRSKSSPTGQLTSNEKQSTNRQAVALVSAIGAGYTQENREDLESFIPQRDVSGILINFGCSNSRQQRQSERLSY
ncbi:hypothetical protein PVAND_012924 [Polypedilum vanderplanki]|uniref:Uncharacterized protein n=1 Tax=Polypedilum vanderplanki TaxID=319348 RepID=A0A9J6CP63_POLVA|nr:hypothetical protein PVAND_012924 [Polypedilum vanderplanki]